MSLELERETLAADFLSRWLTSDGPIAWPNKPFSTPELSMFAVFNIVDRGTVRRSLSSNFFKRREATLQVDIYTPADQGTKRSRQIADLLEDQYQDLVLLMTNGQAIKFRTPSSRVLDTNVLRAMNLDDNWDRYVFEAPFYRDIYVEN